MQRCWVLENKNGPIPTINEMGMPVELQGSLFSHSAFICEQHSVCILLVNGSKVLKVLPATPQENSFQGSSELLK